MIILNEFRIIKGKDNIPDNVIINTITPYLKLYLHLHYIQG